MTYSRQSPSPRFTELVGYYAKLHEEGDTEHRIKAGQMFDGRSLSVHVSTIMALLRQFGSKTLLDYGAGKAKDYEGLIGIVQGREVRGLKALWNLDEIRLYDPGYAPHATLPEGQFDAVICTDVLEHIPEEDIPWVLDELFGYARHFVYASVAIYPAAKTLPNGENVHVTLKPVDWWGRHFDAARARAGGVHYAMLIEKFHDDPNPQAFATFG